MLFSQSLIPTVHVHCTVHVLFTCCVCNFIVVEGILTLDTLKIIYFSRKLMVFVKLANIFCEYMYIRTCIIR